MTKPSPSFKATFLSAVGAMDVEKAQHLWRRGGRQFPSMLREAWQVVNKHPFDSESLVAMEQALAGWTQERSVSQKWKSATAVEAIWSLPPERGAAWDRRWGWASGLISWASPSQELLTDHLATMLTEDSQEKNNHEWRRRWQQVLECRPRLSGEAWGVLGQCQLTKSLALELPEKTDTTAQQRGALLALACLTIALRPMAAPWRASFETMGFDLEIGALGPVDCDRSPGVERLAQVLHMDRTDIYQFNRFMPTDVLDDLFEEGTLSVAKAWGKMASKVPEEQVRAAHLFLLEYRLPPSELPQRKVRM